VRRKSVPSRQACSEHHGCSGLGLSCECQTKQHRLGFIDIGFIDIVLTIFHSLFNKNDDDNDNDNNNY